MISCSIEGCEKGGRIIRGYCAMHYYRLRTYGDPHKLIKLSNGTLIKHLKEVVMKSNSENCIVWPHSRGRDGYGNAIFVDGRRSRPHILVCEIKHGPRPTRRHEAAHSCGKGHEGCVNPTHLSWKTATENQQDRKFHGTYQYGELNPYAKLSAVQVKEIRVLGGTMSMREIAEMYGISRRNVSHILARRSWAH